MDIPMNARVQCADGPHGRTVRVVINPLTRQVTHLVVASDELLASQYLVPIELVIGTSPELVRLRCTKEQLEKQPLFAEMMLLPGNVPFYPYAAGEYLEWPFVYPEPGFVIAEEEHVPPGELAMRRGARVRATDGDIGRVDEFVIDPATESITHLVLQEGHLWGRKDVTIPVSAIDRIEEETVYLKLDKQAIEALPAVPVKRHARIAPG